MFKELAKQEPVMLVTFLFIVLLMLGIGITEVVSKLPRNTVIVVSNQEQANILLEEIKKCK